MTGIICELNPLHNGHKYLIEKAKECGEPVLLVMSGNFTQRGDSACVQKYERAKAAVLCGADLVVELPFPWCSASADYFARAGVHILDSLGCRRMIFGSESGERELILKAGNALASGYDSKLKEMQKNNPSDGAAAIRSKIIEDVLGHAAEKLKGSNDILGVEYVRHASFRGIECIPQKRTNTPSASELRKMGECTAAEYMPFAFDAFLPPEKLYDAERLAFRLGFCDTDCAEAVGGLGERIKTAAGKSTNGSEMLSVCSTKRYTDARIRRAALYMLTDVKKEILSLLPAYTNVLALNCIGAKILADNRKNSSISLVTKPADTDKFSDKAKIQYETAYRADRLYETLCGKNEGYFLTCSPFVAD